MPRLLPFPRIFHPAAGITEQLPVTRHGIRALVPFPFTATEGPVMPSLLIRNGETGRAVRGICGLLPARCFTDGSVLPHERTLTSRLERQERLVASDGGALGKPVLLTTPTLAHPHPTPGEEETEQVIFYGDDHIYRLQFSPGSPREPIELPGPLVIADGHHRALTHARLAEAGREDCSYIPVVVAGADELVIGTFLRLIDGEGITVAQLADRLSRHFTLADGAAATPPAGPGSWLLSYRNTHFQLSRPSDSGDDTDPAYINEVVLPSLFGIRDTRTDPRIQSVDPPPVVSGEVCFDPLENEKIKLLGFPLERKRFFSVVEGGRTLPPKSTRFEPRVPSGLLVWVP